jgi:hypothetical protein
MSETPEERTYRLNASRGNGVESSQFGYSKQGEATPAAGRAIGGKPAPVEPVRPELDAEQRFTNKLRGHNFMPPKAELKKIPPIGTYNETPLDEIPIRQHYFSRSGAGNWYVAEYDPEFGTAWGYADLTGSTGEWGQFDMVELEQLHVGWTVIERDCHFGTPMNMGTIRSLGY